jgi:hypothetical protein
VSLSVRFTNFKLPCVLITTVCASSDLVKVLTQVSRLSLCQKDPNYDLKNAKTLVKLRGVLNIPSSFIMGVFGVVKFVIVMLVMIIVCTLVWELFVNGSLYNCTDPGFLDFLNPGDWVHFHHGVTYVQHIVTGRSMSDPDTIRQGWSVAKLWCLWWSFVFASFLISAALARKTWLSGKMPQSITVSPSYYREHEILYSEA